MNRASRWIIVVTFLSCATLRGLQAQEATPSQAKPNGDFLLFAGEKYVNRSDWAQGQTHLREFGFLASIGEGRWPVRLGVNLLFSSGSDPTQTNPFSIVEFGVGPYKVWSAGRTRPYVGGGIALFSATAEFSFPGGEAPSYYSASQTALGPWIDAGVFWRLGARFDLGIGVRWSQATVSAEDAYHNIVNRGSVGGFHYGIILGFGSSAAGRSRSNDRRGEAASRILLIPPLGV